MPKPFYYQVERGIMSLINALKSDTVQTAENSFSTSLMLPDSVAKNPMFPPLFIRAETMNLERLIAHRICLTDGHPRRVDFLVVQPRIHGQALLSSAGGIGSVYLESSGSKFYFENRPIDVVEANRPNPEHIDVGASSPRAERLWGWDGARFFLSTDDTVQVEMFDYQLSYSDYTQLNGFFSVTVPSEAKLALEFQSAWECGTAAVLAAKVGTFAREASDYWGKFLAMMEAQGVQMRMELDFATKESR